MARIRTIKPEFFKHERLFDLEEETGLPIRLAFIGLWTQADREGRFEWRPRQLKADILPYDDIDFSRVLDALATRGFVVRYASNDREYGFIPSWRKHQVINNKERASGHPEPLKKDLQNNNIDNASSTREQREAHATTTRERSLSEMTLRKGREGKGREGERKKERIENTTQQPFSVAASKKEDCCVVDPDEDLDITHPDPQFDKRGKDSPDDAVKIIAAFDVAIETAFGKSGGRPFPHQHDLVIARRWIETGITIQHCRDVFSGTMAAKAAKGQPPPASLNFFDGFIADKPPAKPKTDGEFGWEEPQSPGQAIVNGHPVNDWRAGLMALRDAKVWPKELGPRPGETGCLAPPDIVTEFGFGAANSGEVPL